MCTKGKTLAVRRLVAAGVLIGIVTAIPGAMAESRIRIGGTGNALGAMRLAADAFMAGNPDLHVVVLPSLGSSGAIKAVPKGALEIGLVARPLTDEERKPGLVDFEYARTPLVFAVPNANPVAAITLAEVEAIYLGTLSAWRDGSQIRPVLRQAGDDNTRQVQGMSPGLDGAVNFAAKRPGLPFATTDQESADKAETVPGAITVTSLSLVLSEKRRLHALALDGVEPTVANGASGRYPYYKRMFLVTRAERSPEVARFIAFLKSAEGRSVLVRYGNWVP